MSGRRWMAWALGASLAANLVVAGALVGAALSGPSARGGPRGAPTAGGAVELSGLVRALAPAERIALRRALVADGAVGAGRAAMGAARAEVVAALRAEPFDPARLEAALEGVRARRDALGARGAAALAAVAARMGPEARAAYADRVAAMPERRPRLRPRDRP